MDQNRLHWKIAGAAGQGMRTAGLVFAKTCVRAGLHAFGYSEHPDVIRGGHASYQVRVEDDEVPTVIRPINLLVALNDNAIHLHKDELAMGGVILYDDSRVRPVDLGRDDVRLLSVPTLKISQRLKLSELMENQIFLGASFALLKFPFPAVASAIRDVFREKGEEVIGEDLAAAQAGYSYAQEHLDGDSFEYALVPVKEPERRLVISGKEAVALGAVQAGCKLFSSAPFGGVASSVKEFPGVVVHQAEDEVGAAGMVLGASFAGVRSLCDVSSSGFAGMQAAHGLAAMTETPLVMVEVMRPGPAVGMPRWTSQENLLSSLHASSGEFPRYVLAPGDPQECFSLVAKAFNIAENLHVPVILLLDTFLAESHRSTPLLVPDAPVQRGPWVTNQELEYLASRNVRFKRYAFSDGGVSVRSVPGQHPNGIFLANAHEHDEFGYDASSPEVHRLMVEKRMQKAGENIPPKVYGPADATLSLLCWGSTKGASLEAMKWLRAEGYHVNVIHVTQLSPFPKQEIESLLKRPKMVVAVECSSTAQLASLVRAETGISLEHAVLQYDGRPLFPELIADKVRSLIRPSKEAER